MADLNNYHGQGAVRLLRFLPVLAGVMLIFGGIKLFYVFRARAMRALAAKWGFQYIGPRAPLVTSKWNRHSLSPLPNRQHSTRNFVEGRELKR